MRSAGGLPGESCAGKLKVLADPTRLSVLEILLGGPKHVGAINAVLRIDQTLLSHHLSVLRHAGLVRDERRGKYVVYSLHPNVSRPAKGGRPADCLDFGCCRLLLRGGRRAEVS